MQKDTSPFTPGSPVGLDLFAGRAQQLEEVSRYVMQAASGRQENVFLIGDRGIGKSSFASVIRALALSDYEMVGVPVFLGGVNTLEELTRRVVEELVQVGRGQPWYERMFQLLGDRVKEVGVLGLKVSFDAPASDLSAIAGMFPEALGDLVVRITEDNRKGVVIVLDDINGLAETPTFAQWYKSLVDKIAMTQSGSYPVLIMLSGVPERRRQLARHEPSLMRVFRIIELDRLSNDEVSDFFQRAFGLAGMTVTEDAMSMMVHYSSGLPIMMQEIGDATFRTDSDGLIDESDAVDGLALAALSVGLKYLEPSVLTALQSPRYHSIFRKIGESLDSTFTRQQIMARLTSDEKKVFDNLLRRLRELGVVEQVPEWGRGAYRYTNQIYPVYMYMESRRK